MLVKRIPFYFLLFLSAITFAFIPLSVIADSNSESTHRILKSASELNYPPFALVRPDGSADGFSVDLLKAVSQAVGMEITFIVAPWHEIKQKLTAGHIDVLPLVSYSRERDKIFDFTAPYLRMHGTIFVRKDEKTIHGEADLQGKEILIMRGDTAHEYAIKKNLSDKLILTDSFEEAMKRLSAGENDAVIIQQVAGHQLIKKLEISNVVDIGISEDISLKPVDKPLSGFEQKFCIAVQDGDKELLARLNEGLAIIIAVGTYNELYNKWFEPILPKPPIRLSRILKYALVIIGPSFFLFAILGIWYLKQEVSKKTLALRQEIEDRKQAAEALQTSEDLHKEAQRVAHIGHWELYPEIGIPVWSDEIHRIFGLNPQESEPSFTDHETHLHPDDWPILNKAVTLASAEGTPFDITFRIIQPDDVIRWIHAIGTTTKDEKGKVTKLFGTAQDITERKQMAKQRDKLISDLQKTLLEVKTLRGFLPICSHCKKIRVDKGYWNQIEAYIQDRSDAEFSHSICQECAEKYYPEMNRYDEDEVQE